jgi:hypothetical protein
MKEKSGQMKGEKWSDENELNIEYELKLNLA